MTARLYLAIIFAVSAIVGWTTVGGAANGKLGASMSPAALFQGYDSVSSGALNTAITGNSSSRSGHSTVTYSVCETTESLYRALDISQSAYLGFLRRFSAREKSSFVKKLQVTTHSTTILVHARNEHSIVSMTSANLRSGIKAPVNNTQLNQFFLNYGDSFIQSLTLGSEYYAAYIFYAKTKTEQETLSTSIRAHFGLGLGLGLTAKFQEQIDDIRTKTTVASFFHQDVTGLKNPALPQPENLVNYALNFLQQPLASSPAILSYITQGYEHVPGITNFAQIAKNRVYFVGNEIIGGLSADLVKISELSNAIDDLQEIYNFYGYTNDQKTKDNKKLTETDIAAIDSQIVTFETNPTYNFIKPSLKSLTLGSPQLQYAVNKSPQQGGNGGSSYDDVDVNNYIQKQTRISAIQVLSDKKHLPRKTPTVYRFIVTYLQKDGVTRTVTHGKGGNSSPTLQIQTGNFVTKVAGRSGDEVDRLEFTYGNAGSPQLANGGNGGNAFSWSVPANSVVMGFSGRSDDRLDQIRTVYATFQPAKWS